MCCVVDSGAQGACEILILGIVKGQEAELTLLISGYSSPDSHVSITIVIKLLPTINSQKHV